MILFSDNSKFFPFQIPDNASKSILWLKDVNKSLKKRISACEWEYLTDDCICLGSDIKDGYVYNRICFTDINNHTHYFAISPCGNERVQCEYMFEGRFDESVTSIRSYAEWLMLRLLQFGIEARLCNYNYGLIVDSNTEQALEVTARMLDIVTDNIKPIAWFLSREPIWPFYRTYFDLCKMLPLLQEEAAKGRWKGVKPSNFRLTSNAGCALIHLDYTDDCNYTMHFCIGMEKQAHGADHTDRYMNLLYTFENQASAEEEAYTSFDFDNEGRAFLQAALAILRIPFSWKAQIIPAGNRFHITTPRENAFQKYCLLLDCILPLLDQYKTSEFFIDANVSEMIAQLEYKLSSGFEIDNDQCPDPIFSRGHFVDSAAKKDNPSDTVVDLQS